MLTLTVVLVSAPNMASSPASSPRLDDASMSYLSRAEAIIHDELGQDELAQRQQNQSDTFKVPALSPIVRRNDGRVRSGQGRSGEGRIP